MAASILFLGLLMGLRHAVEADHVAAVTSLSARGRVGRPGLTLGFLWGAGHALTLFAAGAVFMLLDPVTGQQFGYWLQLAVGVMLVCLGADLIRRMWLGRIHFHAHQHRNRARHLHAHAHAGETRPHDASNHDHTHPHGLSLRAFLIGMMHGSAGSAALAILTLQTLQSFSDGLVYLAVYGVGSIIGMGVLTAIISLPLCLASTSLTRVFNFMQGGIGAWTIGLGMLLIYEQAGLISA